MNAVNQENLSENNAFSFSGKITLNLAARCNAELYRTFRKQIYGAISLSALNSMLVVAIVWNSVPHVPLIAWSAFLVGLSILRLVIMVLRRRRKMLTDEEAIILRRASTAVITVAGCVWGLGGIFVILETDSMIHQVFMVFVIGACRPARWRVSPSACPPFTAIAYPPSS